MTELAEREKKKKPAKTSAAKEKTPAPKKRTGCPSRSSRTGKRPTKEAVSHAPTPDAQIEALK